MNSIKPVAFFCLKVLSLLTLPYTIFTSVKLAVYLSSHDVPRKVHWEYDDEETLWWPLLVNLNLVWLFIGQHSLMALPCFKDTMVRSGLSSLHRIVYLFATSVAIQILVENWQPLPATPLWLIDTSSRHVTWTFFFILHAVCWLVICLAMDTLEMLGLKQLWYETTAVQRPVRYKMSATHPLYRHMSHPGAGCLLVVLWVHPVMTLGRMFLAATWTFYLLCGFQVIVHDYVYPERHVIRQKTRVTRMYEMTE